MDLETLCKNLKGKEYDRTYVNGCEEFKEYDSFDEYVKDVIICLMAAYPHYDLKRSKEIVLHDMGLIEHSFEVKEPAFDIAIGVGYSCG